MPSDLRIDFYEPYDADTGDRWAGDFPRRRIADRIQALISDNSAELSTGPTRWLQPQVIATPKGKSGRPAKATFLSVYRIRSDNWPYFSRQGQVTPLDVMIADAGDDDGIADVTHFGMFPGNILVVVYNHFGPRASALGRYLHDKVGVNVDFRPVVRDDMLETLQNAGTVRRLTVKFPGIQAPAIREAGGFGADAAELAEEIPDTDVTVEFVLKGKAATGNPATRVKQVARELLESVAAGALKTAAVEIGSEDDYGRTMLNLLEDELVLTVPVPAGIVNKRYMPEGQAVRVLRESYRNMRPILQETLGPLEEDSTNMAGEPQLPPVPDEPG